MTPAQRPQPRSGEESTISPVPGRVGAAGHGGRYWLTAKALAALNGPPTPEPPSPPKGDRYWLTEKGWAATGGPSRSRTAAPTGEGGNAAREAGIASTSPAGRRLGGARARRYLAPSYHCEQLVDPAWYVELMRRLHERESVERIAFAAGVSAFTVANLIAGRPQYLRASTARRLDTAEAGLDRLPPRATGKGRADRIVDEVAVERAVHGIPIHELTPQERRAIAERIGTRRSAREIASLIGVSRRTIVRYRTAPRGERQAS